MTRHCLTFHRISKHFAPAPVFSPDTEHHTVLHTRGLGSPRMHRSQPRGKAWLRPDAGPSNGQHRTLATRIISGSDPAAGSRHRTAGSMTTPRAGGMLKDACSGIFIISKSKTNLACHRIIFLAMFLGRSVYTCCLQCLTSLSLKNHLPHPLSHSQPHTEDPPGVLSSG